METEGLWGGKPCLFVYEQSNVGEGEGDSPDPRSVVVHSQTKELILLFQWEQRSHFSRLNSRRGTGLKTYGHANVDFVHMYMYMYVMHVVHTCTVHVHCTITCMSNAIHE